MKSKGKKVKLVSHSDSDTKDESVSDEEKYNYIIFSSSVVGEIKANISDVDALTKSSHHDSDDEDDLQVAYTELFNGSLAIKKTCVEVTKKLRETELERNKFRKISIPIRCVWRSHRVE